MNAALPLLKGGQMLLPSPAMHASHDVGFGDVNIRSTEQGITHAGVESLFLNRRSAWGSEIIVRLPHYLTALTRNGFIQSY